jgi:hypothetical protein
MTPGVDCDFMLAHPTVNGGAAVGFFLAVERGRKTFASRRSRASSPVLLATGGAAYAEFGPGPREWRLCVRFEPHGVDARQAAARGGALARLRELYAAEGAPLTLTAPDGGAYSVRFLELSERLHPPDPGVEADVTLAEA